MLDSVKLAVGTLSVLPTGVPGRVDRVVAGRAMLLAPVVGLVLGGIAGAAVAAASWLQPGAPLLAGVIGVVVLVVLSGGLHLDGLADTADALGSRRDRETMLRIMKQSDIGPYGVLAILLVLLLDIAALSFCTAAGFGWQAALLAGLASRLTLPWSCRTTVPAARPDGLGAGVAATVKPLAAVLVTTVAALAAVSVVLLTTPASVRDRWSSTNLVDEYGYPLSGPTTEHWFGTAPKGSSPDMSSFTNTTNLATMLAAGAATAVLAALIAIATSRRARRLLGGITGDTLGAAVELTVAAALLVLALAL